MLYCITYISTYLHFFMSIACSSRRLSAQWISIVTVHRLHVYAPKYTFVNGNKHTLCLCHVQNIYIFFSKKDTIQKAAAVDKIITMVMTTTNVDDDVMFATLSIYVCECSFSVLVSFFSSLVDSRRDNRSISFSTFSHETESRDSRHTPKVVTGDGEYQSRKKERDREPLSKKSQFL